MNYYVLQNDEITLFDTDKSRLQKTVTKFRPELSDEKIHQTTKEIVKLDGKYVFADEYQEEIEQQQQQKEDEEKQQTLDRAIDELIKEMAQADLMGDEDWKAELREQYQTLINGDEE